MSSDKSLFRLNAAIIGLGVGEQHIKGYSEDSRCKVVALCDFDEKKLAEVGSRYPNISLTKDSDKILSDPLIDIVSIASYDNFHHDQIIAALRNGKHIFVEKPLCLNRTEYESISCELQKNKDLKISSNLILRKSPRFKELRSRIQKGMLGEVYFLEGDYDYGRINKLTDGWRGRIKNYSVVCGGAIHLIDLLLWLTGKRIDEVFAYGNNFCTKNLNQFQNPDLVVALLKFTDGTIAKVSANFGSVTPHLHRVCVYGTAGSFTQGHLGASYLSSRNPEDTIETLKDSYPGVNKGDMLPSFINSILDGVAAEVTPQEVLDVMNVAIAIDESLLINRPVSLKYLNLKD